mgnify:FL=1
MLTSGRVRTWCVRAFYRTGAEIGEQAVRRHRRDGRNAREPAAMRWEPRRSVGSSNPRGGQMRHFHQKRLVERGPTDFGAVRLLGTTHGPSRSRCGRAGSKDPSTNPGVAFGAPKGRSLETRIATRLSSLEGIGTRDAGGDLSRLPKMGTSSSKSKKASKSKAAAKRAQDQVTEVDRQVLGLKTQKRKLNAYAKRVEVRPDVPTPAAKRTTRPWPKITKITKNNQTDPLIMTSSRRRPSRGRPPKPASSPSPPPSKPRRSTPCACVRSRNSCRRASTAGSCRWTSSS